MSLRDIGGLITQEDSPDANPFERAAGFVGTTNGNGTGIAGFVYRQIDRAATMAQSANATANEVFDQLGGFAFNPPDAPIRLPDPINDFEFEIAVTPIQIPDLGDPVEWEDPAEPVFEGTIELTPIDIPEFDPSFTNFIIKPPPGWNPGTVPVASYVPYNPEFPPDLVLIDPVKPTLYALSLPAIPEVNIPTFSPTFPEFTEVPPTLGIEWSEPEYTRIIVDQVLTQLQTFFAGGTGLSVPVEDGIWNRSAEREDRATNQTVMELTEEYAGRGFVAPPGMMQKRIDAVRAERDLKKQGNAREQAIEAQQIEIENLRFAVQQGLQAEDLFIRLHLAAADRAFNVARSVVEFSMQLYGLQIEVFRAQLERVSIEARAYETQVRGALAIIELYTAQIEAEQTKANINQTLVDSYRAEVQTLQVFVERYEAQIRAESVKVEAVSAAIRGYGEEVNAYAARVGAEKLKFDAYDSQVRGELGKASIVESEARAYAAEVGAISEGANAEARIAEAETNKYRADIAKFAAQSTSMKDEAEVGLRYVQTNLAGLQANTQKFVAEAGLGEATARIGLAEWEGKIRNQIEFYKVELAEWDTRFRHALEEARLVLTAMTSSGDLAGTINAGALAAMHVGASISGSGSVQSSGSLSESFGQSKTISQSHSQSDQISQEVSYNIEQEVQTVTLPPGAPPWGDVGGTN